MPNNGRITLCPYYRDEKNLSISCEDTFRRFRWPAQKRKWLDKYCDADWQECPHAKKLTELYSSMEGEDMNSKIKRLEHENEELRKELRKHASMLGKAQKREEQKDELIRKLRHEKDVSEKLYFKERDQNRKYEEERQKFLKEMEILSQEYETRFAYLMAAHKIPIMREREFRKWVAENEFRLDAKFTDSGELYGYKVEWRKIDEHGAEGSARENAKTGGGENRRTERRKNLN